MASHTVQKCLEIVELFYENNSVKSIYNKLRTIYDQHNHPSTT